MQKALLDKISSTKETLDLVLSANDLVVAKKE